MHLPVAASYMAASTALGFLQCFVVQKLLDKINMSHKHSSTAIPNQTQCIKSIPFGVISLEKIKVLIPFVSDDLKISEATDWYDHPRFSLDSVCPSFPAVEGGGTGMREKRSLLAGQDLMNDLGL
nr:hypothetical protein Iba_chr12aCG18000 [Ipomoea batatas]